MANRGRGLMAHRLRAHLLRLKILADVLGQKFLLFAAQDFSLDVGFVDEGHVRDELSARVRGGARFFARTAFELA